MHHNLHMASIIVVSIISLLRVLLISLCIFQIVTSYAFKHPQPLIRAFQPNLHLQSSQISASTSIPSLPIKLTEIVSGLKTVQDDKLRYQELLFLASKAQPMPDNFKIDSNKVPGCLSTVYVHAWLDSDGLVQYLGDSDAQLTKGLVSLLVNGLSGATIDEINNIDPAFIKDAGISNSLTPGRNNGFLNMLNVMKKKASNLKNSLVIPQSIESLDNNNSSNTVSETPAVLNQGPLHNSISKKLALLQPDQLEIVNESSKHIGHAGIQDSISDKNSILETHFNVKIVAAAFEGLTLVQRHKMIYTLLANEMKDGKIHALSLSTKTPKEVLVNP